MTQQNLQMAVVACQALAKSRSLTDEDMPGVIVPFVGMGPIFLKALGKALEVRGWKGAERKFEEASDMHTPQALSFSASISWARSEIVAQEEFDTGVAPERFEQSAFYREHGNIWEYLRLSLIIDFSEVLSAGDALDFLLAGHKAAFLFDSRLFGSATTQRSLAFAAAILKGRLGDSFTMYLQKCGLSGEQKSVSKPSHLKLV